MGDWLFAGSITEWQGDEAIFEIRNYINAGDEIEFLSPEGLRNITLKLTEFEDASTGEISQKVSAGQGKSIRIKPSAWSLPIDEIKRLLPQYVIARKFSPLKDENRKMLDNKISEFNTLCND